MYFLQNSQNIGVFLSLPVQVFAKIGYAFNNKDKKMVRLDFVQRRPARPTRYQPRATPWVNNGVDCALQGQKPYRCHHAFALAIIGSLSSPRRCLGLIASGLSGRFQPHLQQKNAFLFCIVFGLHYLCKPKRFDKHYPPYGIHIFPVYPRLSAGISLLLLHPRR